MWPIGGRGDRGRAAGQVGAVGSLPLSRCATAPPRGERLDRVVRGATPGWQALAPRSARSVRRWLPRVGAAAGGGRAAAQVGAGGSLPHSRCATAPPRGERLERAVRGATPGWQALAPRSARSVRRWLPRVGAAEGGGGGRAAAQVGGAGNLPHSRCATAPPRGERLERAARGWLQAGRLWLLDRRAPFGGGSPEWELPKAEGEAVRRPRLAGLGASPTVAARQLPLGGSDWIGLFGGRLQAGRLWLLDRRAPFGGGSPEGELPEAEGEAVRRPRLAGLGASPTVAARQLPLGGSDWIGLFGRGVLSWRRRGRTSVGAGGGRRGR